MKWIIVLVVIAALGWFGVQYMNNNAALEKEQANAEIARQAEAAAASEKAGAVNALVTAQESMPAGIDLSKINDRLEGAFLTAGDALSGITDVESAQSALPSLEQASSTISDMDDTIVRLPDAAKGALARNISGRLATIQPMIEKATAIPGVGDVIGPVVTPMMEMLEALSG